MVATAVEHEALPGGTTFGRYRIVRLLGAGGMGAVYEAVHEILDKRVALKVLHRTSTTAVERFVLEGRAAARVQHPNIVTVTDIGAESATPFLVMEYLEGESLAEASGRGPMSPEAVAEILLPVLDAIQAAHDARVIHRDLKPDNIFLVSTSHGVKPKVLDFGVSKLVDPDAASGLTGTGSILGTPSYMSPEQTRAAKSVDHRTDLYAIGVIVYELLTGARPFQGEGLFELMVAIVEGERLPLRTRRPDLGAEVERFVDKSIAIEADDRFQSAHEMARALLPLAAEHVRTTWSQGLSGGAAKTSPHTPTLQQPVTRSAVREKLPIPDPAGLPPAHRGTPVRWVLAGAGAVFAVALGLAAAAWMYMADEDGPSAEIVAAPMVAPVAETPPETEPVDVEPIAAPSPAPAPRATTQRITVTVSPAEAELLLDGESVGEGRLEQEMVLDGSEHVLVVSAEGHESQRIVFSSSPPPEEIVLAPSPTPEPVEAPTEPERTTRRTRRPRSYGQPTRGRPPSQFPSRPPATSTRARTRPAQTRGANGSPLIY